MAEKYKVSQDVAEQTVAEMEEEFGALGDENSRAVVLDAAMRGLITWDSENATVTYTLQRPIEVEEEQPVASLTFEEPNVEEIEKINRGIQVHTDSNGNAVMDLSIQTQQTKKIVSVLGVTQRGDKIPGTLLNRMKRRDWGVLEALAAFFG